MKKFNVKSDLQPPSGQESEAQPGSAPDSEPLESDAVLPPGREPDAQPPQGPNPDAHVPDVPQGPEWEEPSRWDRQGSAFGNEGRDWSSVASSLQGTSRVLSQNVGPVGFRNSRRLIESIIHKHQPAVLLLQDCRVRKDKIKEVTAEARQQWPEYKIFMTSSQRISKSRCERSGMKVIRRFEDTKCQ